MKGRYGRFSKVKVKGPTSKSGSITGCQLLVVMLATVMIPWGIYVTLHPRFINGSFSINIDTQALSSMGAAASNVSSTLEHNIQDVLHQTVPALQGSVVEAMEKVHLQVAGGGVRVPVLGPIVKNGQKPLWNFEHQGGDAIFALACNYKLRYYQRFVGTLRDAGYKGDIVLAVSPQRKMAPGVEDYLKQQNVVAYPFEVECLKKDNCKFTDDFLGYPDPRPHRTFANIRYALYEYWLNYYKPCSYIMILDFRDTFFQKDPFETFGYPIDKRTPKYELHVFAENFKVKNIKKCVYNSLWVGRCFGKPALEQLKDEAVLCSGSTLGSFAGIDHYVSTMLRSMDEVQCWRKGIESDQGYQNYLFYNGYFNTVMGNATFNHQGHGVVNTIGAMNGRRVPKDQKGPLDTFWKIRDGQGYILNYDGSRSAVVHQWDRFYSEIVQFLDTKLLKLKGKGPR